MMVTPMPKTLRRPLLIAAATLLAAPRSLRAQAWSPDHPVRLVVPFAAGGLTDILTRALAEPLSQRLGQPVVVENRGGAGGNIAAEAVARSAPDGHTLLIASQGIIIINKALFARLSYDPDTDFVPLAMMAQQANVLVANPAAFPEPTLPAILARAKAAPGTIVYGSTGVGSFTHLSMEMLRQRAGVDLTHVPYRGSAPQLTDLIAGQIPMALDALGTSLPNIRAGVLRAVAVTSASRSRVLPDVPAVAETLPGYDATAWYGVFGLSATPEPVLARLDAEIRAVVNSPSYRRMLEDRGADPKTESRAELAAGIARERPLWQAAVRESGATVN